MKIRYAGSTHVGMKRSLNEDSLYLFPEENLYVVADGMGGHASGEVASRLAVETMAEFFRMTAADQEMTWPFKEDKTLVYDQNRLSTAIKVANLRVWEMSQSDARYAGMGTTVVAMSAGPGGAYMAHVGDSRGYLMRDGRLTQVTEDHSLLNDYLKVHKLTPEEIEHFPHKNVIVRALGMKSTVLVESQKLSPRPGDIYMLCSDGLSGMIDDRDMEETIAGGHDDLEAISQKLISQANRNGGQDNITVILIAFSE